MFPRLLFWACQRRPNIDDDQIRSRQAAEALSSGSISDFAENGFVR